MVQHLLAGTDVETCRPQVLNEDDLNNTLSVPLLQEDLHEHLARRKEAHHLARQTVLSLRSYRLR